MLLPLLLSNSYAQTNQQTASVAELARANRKEKKEQSKLVFNEDAPPTPKPLIPDIVTDGFDNTDEIIKSILSYKATHNPQETEAAVHAWFDKHDGIMVNALELNKRMEQADRARLLGNLMNDYHPRTQQEMLEHQRNEAVSRQEEAKRKQENASTLNRVQQGMNRVRTSLIGAGIKYEWFKVRCGAAYCS
jgi:hypothetical protein